MDVLALYPDAEQVVLDLLEQVAPTVTALSGDITAPVIAVARAGGPADLITDAARIVVGSYAPDRATAWNNARLCQQIILAARNKSVNGVQIDHTGVLLGLQQLPYGNPNEFHVTGTYEVTFRRPRTT